MDLSRGYPAGFAFPIDHNLDMSGMGDRPPPYNYSAVPQVTLTSLPVLTEEDVREALTEFVSKECCFGKEPLKHMVIRSIEPATTFHLRLESFLEHRDTMTAEEPYDGGCFDSIGSGPTPDIWSLPIFHTPFQNGEKLADLAHTTKLVVCSECAGGGRRPCHSCSGHGRLTCTHDSMGPGFEATRCPACRDTGDALCKSCNGVGQRLCTRCQGHGRMRSFLRVKSIATTHKTDQVIASAQKLPSEKIIQNGSGAVVYDDEGQTVPPIAHFPDQRVVQASNRTLQAVVSAHRQERMLRQRQTVSAVPVTQVICTYKEKEATFHIYGLNNKVNFPDYFDQCGCCTIL